MEARVRIGETDGRVAYGLKAEMEAQIRIGETDGRVAYGLKGRNRRLSPYQ